MLTRAIRVYFWDGYDERPNEMVALCQCWRCRNKSFTNAKIAFASNCCKLQSQLLSYLGPGGRLDDVGWIGVRGSTSSTSKRFPPKRVYIRYPKNSWVVNYLISQRAQGHLQEIFSLRSYVEFAGTWRHKHLAPNCHVEDLCPMAGVEGSYVTAPPPTPITAMFLIPPWLHQLSSIKLICCKYPVPVLK